jgi:hypothetical protein
MNQQPPARQQVTSPIVSLAHNAQLSTVALYGELLSEQEKKMQVLVMQLGSAQQQCVLLSESVKAKDAQLEALRTQMETLLVSPAEPVVGSGG